jgi:hypothetical protein
MRWEPARSTCGPPTGRKREDLSNGLALRGPCRLGLLPERRYAAYLSDLARIVSISVGRCDDFGSCGFLS